MRMARYIKVAEFMQANRHNIGDTAAFEDIAHEIPAGEKYTINGASVHARH